MKTRPKKRPWYAPKVQKSQAQKVFAYALYHSWELRPQHLGIWVIARGRCRLFTTWTEEGKFTECVLIMSRPHKDDVEKKLTAKQMLHVIKRMGHLYYPEVN